MESAHQFSFIPDCNNTAEVHSFTLRTALSTIPFVSDLCGVDVQWFQERSSQTLPNSKEITLGFLSGSKNFCNLLCVSCVKFLFCTNTTGSIGWPSRAPRLHIGDCFEIHNCHWRHCDLLLSNHQNCLHEVRLRHCVFCTGPCNLCPLADLAISVFGEKSIKTVLTQILTSLGCGL